MVGTPKKAHLEYKGRKRVVGCRHEVLQEKMIPLSGLHDWTDSPVSGVLKMKKNPKPSFLHFERSG